MKNVEIIKIAASETYQIRLEVLRENIPLPYKFDGDLDEETFHFGAFIANELIAVSSYMKVSNKNFTGNQYQLRGMATLSKYQGCGAGKLMMDEAFAVFKKLDVNCLWCNARVIAVDFYKKQGLQTFGEKFDIPYVGDHYVMYKYLI